MLGAQELILLPKPDFHKPAFHIRHELEVYRLAGSAAGLVRELAAVLTFSFL